ncbi:F-box protein At2g17036-like [Momordica charantia]|uniref:F-box protein At2g17036-like n=1 Tax=Momordica charantia TaxID=3673 RepID=A0A6J1E1R2_MOMCH|nr:F-box protein At2g17036-like [Momordica charantia]
MDDGGSVRWSDLPPELWTAIAKCLDSFIDVLRCRSVCRLWRASLPRLNAVSPFVPLSVPIPPLNDDDLPIKGAILIREITYRLGPLRQTSSSSAADWSEMVTEDWSKMVVRMRTKIRKQSPPGSGSAVRRKVNLLDFRILEVNTSYFLLSTDPHSHIPGIDKIVMSPDSPWIHAQDCTVLALRGDGKLGFVKLRPDGEWTLIEEQNNNNLNCCDDVIAWKGQFYAIDKSGAVFRIDSESMKLKRISPPLRDSGERKHLVKCGKLYAVDRFDSRGKGAVYRVFRVDFDGLVEVDFEGSFSVGMKCWFWEASIALLRRRIG